MADPVSIFIHDLCHTERFGGRCIRMSDHTWEILDIERWTEDRQEALRGKFPRITSSIITNRKSLSGFSIVLSMQRISHVWLSLLTCAIIMTIALTIAGTLK
jgi:hypothetical protein